MNPYNPTPGALDPGLEAEYEILDELGRGGVSIVYLARDRVLGREVAIKVIRDAHLDDEEALSRFEREARVLASLQHPNIVTLYTARRLPGGSLALVMQHGNWRTLKEAVRADGPFSAERVEGVLRDIGAALRYLHRHEMVHRDVKPENIFLERETGRALLSDFGIAKHRDGQASVTLTGVVIGTPAYMSPEQIDGAELDGRSDLYSLGMVGYEMITGRRPWEGESLYGVIFKQKNELLPPLRSLRPELPASLSAGIERAVQKRPEDRWADVEAFLAGLTAAPPQPRAPEAALPITAPAPAPSHEALMVQVHRVVAEAERSAPPPAPPARPRRLAFAALAVCVLGSGAAAAMALASGRNSPVPAPASEPFPAAVTSAPSPSPGRSFSDTPPGGADAPAAEAAPASVLTAPLAVSRIGETASGAEAPAAREQRTGTPQVSVLGTPTGSSGTSGPSRQPRQLAESRAPSPAVAGRSEAQPQASADELVLRPVAPPPGAIPELRNRDHIGRLVRFYPGELSNQGIGGEVVLALLVTESGSIADVRVARSSGREALDSAAVQIGRRMEFTATGDSSTPRRVWVNIPLTFEGRPRDD